MQKRIVVQHSNLHSLAPRLPPQVKSKSGSLVEFIMCAHDVRVDV